jgi:hypothetical protein
LTKMYWGTNSSGRPGAQWPPRWPDCVNFGLLGNCSCALGSFVQNYKRSPILRLPLSTVKVTYLCVSKKIHRATLWPILSQTHPVTLADSPRTWSCKK